MDTPAHSASAATPEQPKLSQEEYARSRHAVWLSAAALMTDELGRVLLVKPTYRTQWLLPGGGAEPGESPEQTCRREVHEELGMMRTPGRILAVHWLTPGHPDVAKGMPFPGEVRYVFDGGTLTGRDNEALRLPDDELAGFEFLDSRAAADRMIPVDAQITLAALRARLTGTTAHLDGGQHVGTVPPLDQHQVHTRPRAGRRWPWHPGRVPDALPIPQASGWLFAPDGRVVLVIDPAEPLAMLPGGTVEPTDESPEAALVREAAEEAQLSLGTVERLGWVYDATGNVYGGIGECARLRLAAPITSAGPSEANPASGRQFARLLATPQQAAALLGWGEQGYQQAEQATRIAHQRWGIPIAPPTPITELPIEGGVS
ncbi:NUDIX hydrolase [Streptomyces sp. Je 1-4]|uniref:NUDIX hydrolase n=1 Tax=Streptomyces TaxID=1883 RepID=UPI0021D9AB79|nr:MULTISPECIES: NUDIX hydrolase [unclassified Streptomyces]UYB39199.1 NUDIX hydrolase [Streptomyces sp. Je 1-4]UZQ35214.1 NUDIX hydrolase [Streptomyces sp. Je 1-4] [Streptomyces sp. Je 1-4 4N24]UZQ42632.1 NUDIX hydrolase [Streptomyces sp. Je 1-4] [Streptomyces sp. Je 1-4 4N24_ara]